MNPALNHIFKRRSVRRFQQRKVEDALIGDLLQAAMAAPSARGRDPWHFLVIRSRETLDRMTEILPNAAMLSGAPLCFLACGDLQRAHGQELSYLLQDVSAAVENLLLAATTLGLGACWLGIHPRTERLDAVIRLFNLPEHIVPVAGIAVGWPALHVEPRTRYRAERVHWEQW